MLNNILLHAILGKSVKGIDKFQYSVNFSK